MFDKIFEAQQKAEEVKKRLETITLSEEVEGGAIKVTATAGKTIKSISIDENFLKENGVEGIEDLLVTAINKVLAQAENVSQTEMAAMTSQMLGGMDGLANLFGKK
ncbi:MAG TPA: YbaB/EbfC family nucleoid-associated protein [Pelobium sp.]|nr:YbaB/EbfC family nucleoid-associated protein [Pelobium sp.]